MQRVLDKDLTVLVLFSAPQSEKILFSRNISVRKAKRLGVNYPGTCTFRALQL